MKKILLTAGICAAIAACTTELPQAPESINHTNIIVVVIDTLRADHLGSYGYHRDTSPVLDRLAADGVRYSRAFSTSTYTRESVAALWTGMLPVRAGHGWRARPRKELPNLASTLKEAGYATLFVSNHPALRSPAYAEERGWDRVHHVSDKYYSGRSDLAVERAIRLLEPHADGPFFLYLHLLDPHAPYKPSSESVEALFGDDDVDGTGFLKIRDQLPEMKRNGFAPGDPDFDAMVKRYDAEIRDVDAAVGTLVEALEKSGHDKHTLVVVTSDHGEEFLEHGFVDHSWTLFRETTHVPLIFWGPGVTPREIDDTVSLVDVYPTVLGMLGIEQAASLDGVSLYREGAFTGRGGKPVIMQMLLQERSMVHGVLDWPWQYLASPRWIETDDRPGIANSRRERTDDLSAGRLPRVSLSDAPVRTWLYHMEDDWTQQRNRSESENDVVGRLRQVLDAVSDGGSDNVEEDASGLTTSEQQELEALGYL